MIWRTWKETEAMKGQGGYKPKGISRIEIMNKGQMWGKEHN